MFMERPTTHWTRDGLFKEEQLSSPEAPKESGIYTSLYFQLEKINESHILLILITCRYATVEELARLGAAVHTCSRTAAELEKCLQEWRDSNLTVTGSVCDVSSLGDREKLMETVSSIFNGKLDILVIN